eukprot:1172612-Rhodomonas_salina.1
MQWECSPLQAISSRQLLCTSGADDRTYLCNRIEVCQHQSWCESSYDVLPAPRHAICELQHKCASRRFRQLQPWKTRLASDDSRKAVGLSDALRDARRQRQWD